MTMRNRQILVAGALVVVLVWAVLAWSGSTATPGPSIGPSPTGAIGPAPITFEPSDALPPP